MKRFTLLPVVVLLAACGDTPVQPSPATDGPLATQVARAIVSPVDADCTHCASGHFNLTIGGGFETMSFQATIRKDGTVTGQARLKSRGQNTTVRVHIDCLTIDGNEAYLNGALTYINEDSPFAADSPVGSRVYWKVQDNGEGKGSVDQWTDMQPVDFASCTDVAFDFLPNEGGNVQVTP